MKRFLYILIPILVFAFQYSCTPKTTEPVYLNHHDSAEYIGMNTCRSCHEDKYNTFMHTGMGQSFYLATPEKSVADFTNIKAVYDSFSNLYYYPYWKKDTLYFKEYRLDGKDTTHLLVKRIDYIIGSGQHTNSHLYQENGYLYQAPLTWYAQKGQWGLPPGFENGQNTRFSRKLDEECMSCHNGLPQFEENSGNFFEHIPMGIDCERCHGPGSEHIKKIASGDLTDTSKEIDFSIVNPGKLGWKAQMDVCQRCHLQGNAVLKEGKRFIDFKPGMRLSDYFNVFLPAYEEENNFIMASHVERLNKSKCFLESNKEGSTKNLTCITCHNPHKSVKETSNSFFNAKCKSCHNNGKDCKEILAKPMYEKENCISCHMTTSGTKDIPHVQIHDHKIALPNTEKSKENGMLIGLKVLNNSSPTDAEMLQGYITYFEKFEQNSLYMDKANSLLEHGNNETKIHYHYNLGDYKSILKIAYKTPTKDIKQAWTFYRIATAYSKENQWTNAEEYADSLVLRAPKKLDFLNKAVEIKLRRNNLAGANGILEKLYKLNPSNESTLIHYAKYWLAKENRGKAKRYIEKALKLFPDSEEGNRLMKLYFIP